MSYRYLIDRIIGTAIQSILDCVFAPTWFNNLATGEIEPYVIFYRYIYPKWLCLKQKNHYHIRLFKQYRRTRLERTRLDIGILIHN